MEDAGWVVTLTPDNGFSFSDVPEEQQEVLSQALTDCQTKFPAPPMNASNLTVLYEAEIAQRDCLVGLGYEMPEPPTLDTYIDSYGSDAWFAISDTNPETMTPAVYADVLRQCPSPVL